jgi:hypothetical protein
MLIRFDFVPDLTHDSILIDQECRSVYPHVLLTCEVLLFPYIVQLGNSCVSIGEKWKIQTILVREFLMRGNTVGADA